MSGPMRWGDLDGFALAASDAVFLDFDGTLAEIGPDPDAIRLAVETAGALTALAGRLRGAVAILSGRDPRDLAARVPAGLWRLGGHGLFVLEPGAGAPARLDPAPAAVARVLREAADAHPGLRLEVKGPMLALHYRGAPDAEPAALAAARMAASAAGSGYVVQPGKMVVEVKPAGANKGRALEALMRRAPFAGRRPVMLGDDRTDEDAIEAAQGVGGIGVKVGEGASAARLRAPHPAALRAWLAREAFASG